MPYPKEIIKSIYRSLPEELGSLVATEEVMSISNEIAQTYSLGQNQKLEMEDEITMRLLGVTVANIFTSNLISRLKVTPEIADKIVGEIKTKILSKVPAEILLAQEESAQAKIKAMGDGTNLPMIEPGEIAHDVPHVETKSEQTPASNVEKPSAPTYNYDKGKDPYREPLV